MHELEQLRERMKELQRWRPDVRTTPTELFEKLREVGALNLQIAEYLLARESAP